MKGQIKIALEKYLSRFGSQNSAANSLRDVSPAIVSQVLNDKWETISEAMWRSIAKQVGYNVHQWNIAETSVFKKITAYFGDAQRNPKGIRAIIANASFGKSTAVNAYCEKHQSAYYIRCHRHMPARILVRDMLKSMGKDSSGTLIEMLQNLVSYLQRDNEPLFIIDEADKLKDEVLELFIDLENKLHQICGFVFLSTPYLQKRIDAGVARSKRGFAELFSRMKKTFFDLTPSPREFKSDIGVICKANGITDEEVIAELMNKCDNDLRKLTDLINAYKQLINK
jgi:DNA transposition AAA+ family ATPase